MNKGWLELESDPAWPLWNVYTEYLQKACRKEGNGLFTLLLEDFGVNGVQVEEIYDLAKPMEGPVYGFIFLFRWIEERRSRRKTNTEVDSFVTDAEAVNNIFFAQQIIPNSCATHALLSVLLNCDNKVKLGDTLNLIKDFTDSMSPEDKGYAIANMPQLAKVHNSYARPEPKPLPEKQSGLSSIRATDSETFHFVSYVPIRGHLFELDGLKPHPIDHGPWEKEEVWTEKFRRVIGDRLSSATGGENDIRFNLMAVVPDKRQLFEHKLVTLKTNRNIVLEALQQLLDAKAVSPESSDRSDSEGKVNVHEVKKSVTFTSAAPAILNASSTIVSKSDSECENQTSSVETMKGATTTACEASVAQAVSKAKLSPTTPASILKPVSSSLTLSSSIAPSVSTLSMSSVAASTNFTTLANSMKLRSSACGDSSTPSPPVSVTGSSTVNADPADKEIAFGSDSTSSQAKLELELKTDESNLDKSVNSVKEEPMDPSDVREKKNSVTEEIKPSPKSHTDQTPPQIKVELAGDTKEEAGANPDVTKPLSIETKFNMPPCAASSESTDTASDIGSGFSSPGSLNTSSCQSSPHFSDGTSGADGRPEEGEHTHSHSHRKRRASHDFTPKDLLDLLKNIENEIEVYEANLKDETEKHKKYKIDACRRTHNYDQFIVTFLEMLAEQGHLGELMEQHMTIKKPGGNAGSGTKMAKKALLKASEKKKQKGKMKKKGKK